MRPTSSTRSTGRSRSRRNGGGVTARSASATGVSPVAGLDLALQATQDVGLLGGCDRQAEQAVGEARPVVQARRRRGPLPPDVDGPRRRRTAAQLAEAGGSPWPGRGHVAGIESLLEARAGLAAPADLFGGAHDVGAVEGGRLEHEVGRCSSTSASIAPKMPAITRARSVSAITRLSGSQGAVDAVEGDDVLAGAGAARDQPAAADLGGVEAVQRLADREHDVVGHVDHVVDGAHAGVREAGLEPGRRLAHRDAADDARAVPGAQVGVGDLDGDRRLGGRAARGRLGDGRRRQRQPGRRRHLAGHAVDRQAVGPVGRDFDLEDRFGDRQVLGSGAPTGQSAGSTTMPGLVCSKPSSCSESIMPSDSTPRRLALRSLRPFSSVAPARDTATVSPAAKLSAPQTIWCTPPPAGPASTVHSQSLSALGWRSLVSTRPTRKSARLLGLVRRPDPVDALDLGPAHAEQLGELLDRAVPGDVLAQPADRHSHQNCSRNRRSLSKNERASGTPCLSIAMRSTPMPKAKPCSSPAS